MSPATIVTGQPKPDMSKKRISFGSYTMAYTSTTNTMKSRSVPAIALSESNKIGGSYFMLLYTGKLIHGFDWNEIPIHDDVIDTVEQLATNEKQPMLICKLPLFEWRPGAEIPDVADDELDNAEIVEVANEVAEEIVNNVDNDDDSVDNEQRADVDGFVTDNDEASILDAHDNENDQDNDDNALENNVMAELDVIDEEEEFQNELLITNQKMETMMNKILMRKIFQLMMMKMLKSI